uniref:Secreted frizzled-related protein 5 n=1 Tax=Eptatretus burgeri TaxID=7764 RepID=A0A8C4Q9W6_EPTBU
MGVWGGARGPRGHAKYRDGALGGGTEREDYGWQADSYATGQHFYSRSAVCVPIPEDLRLCHNVGYRDMRLPNLLEHESMQEVRQQAGAWVPLLAKRCHPDTQLLLCSLFAPVCLDRPIYPCRSLCEAVRDSCVPVMESFGFPWPEMLRCDKFPLDNDLCITATFLNTHFFQFPETRFDAIPFHSPKEYNKELPSSPPRMQGLISNLFSQFGCIRESLRFGPVFRGSRVTMCNRHKYHKKIVFLEFIPKCKGYFHPTSIPGI